MIITTTPTLEGYTITEYTGMVFGEVIFGINIGKDIVAGLHDFFGGRAKVYEDEIIGARKQALAELERRAELMGAYAVVGVKLDIEMLGANNGMIMVTASGTAVRIEKQ